MSGRAFFKVCPMMMPFRVLEYVVHICKAQAREWRRRHSSFAGLRLQPVLPVVFKTPQFYLLWAVLLLNATAGIGVLRRHL
jgi:hypothetical protein